MEENWQRRKILIWGKTRPELSQKYREIVCTGGVFEDTRKLVRLYPIPLRYLDDQRIFKKYQWIEATVAKSNSDRRPESYKIRYDDIKVLNTIPTNRGNWDTRAEWILGKSNIFLSVEQLQEQQKQDATSLALIKPLEIVDVTAHSFSDKEKKEFVKRYIQCTSQMELQFDSEQKTKPLKPLKHADYRFKVCFRCDDPACRITHKFSVLDWETDALYFNLVKKDGPKIASQKVIDKIKNQVCAKDKDLYFFLGNIASHQHIFCIVGFWYPKIKEKKLAQQLDFFDGID